MAKRILRGIAINDETLAVDTIREAAAGGHYLTAEHTARMFRGEFFFPRLFDRRSVHDWESLGGKPIHEVARERVREILG